MRQIGAPDLAPGRTLEWSAGQALRRGVGCAVLVLRPAVRSTPHSPRASGDPALLPALEALASHVRPLLRQLDQVAVEADVGLGIVLHGANAQGAQIVHGRLRQALAPQAPGPSAGVELLIGLATAEPTAPVRVPAVARELCARASAPDQALAFSLGPLGSLAPLAWAPVGARPRRVSQRRRLVRRTRAAHFPVPPALAGATHAGDELDHLRAQADALGVPYVKLPPRLPESLAPLLAPDLLREVRAAPIGRTRDVLTVAMDDPTDRAAIERLATATGLTIFPVLASAGDLARTLR